MSYTQEISRVNPSGFVFLVDQSGSMADEFRQNDLRQRKADFLADAMNRILMNLVLRCSKDDGVRNYFDISVVGYGTNVGPALGGNLAGRWGVPLRELADNPIRVETRKKKNSDGAGGFFESNVDFPIYFEPMAMGGTPMCAAFDAAGSYLSDWISQHTMAFPPVVFNLTDGESTDGDPSEYAQAIKSLATSDGNVVICNVHISSTSPFPLRFPKLTEGMPDNYARTLNEMSSPLTPRWADLLSGIVGTPLSIENQCFIYNAGPEEIVNVLDIGTRANNLR